MSKSAAPKVELPSDSQTDNQAAVETPAELALPADAPAKPKRTPASSNARAGTLDNPMPYEEAMKGVQAGTIKRSVFTERGWLAVEPPRNPNLRV